MKQVAGHEIISQMGTKSGGLEEEPGQKRKLLLWLKIKLSQYKIWQEMGQWEDIFISTLCPLISYFILMALLSDHLSRVTWWDTQEGDVF